MDDSRVLNAACLAMIAIGTRVEIRNQYLHRWSRGFQVAAIIEETYLIRRLADGRLLPRCFGFEDIRLQGGN